MSPGRPTLRRGRGGGGAASQRAGAPTSSEMQENVRVRARPPSFAPPSPQSRSARGAARRVLGVATSASATSSPTRRLLPASSPRREQASSDVAGTSGSALEAAARTGSGEEARLPEHLGAAHARSGWGPMTRSALAKVQEGAGGGKGKAAVAEAKAMAGLTELTDGKAEVLHLPELPHEVDTWRYHDEQVLAAVERVASHHLCLGWNFMFSRSHNARRVLLLVAFCFLPTRAAGFQRHMSEEELTAALEKLQQIAAMGVLPQVQMPGVGGLPPFWLVPVLVFYGVACWVGTMAELSPTVIPAPPGTAGSSARQGSQISHPTIYLVVLLAAIVIAIVGIRALYPYSM